MVDGTANKSEESKGLNDMAGVASENRVHVARPENMSPEEFNAIGDECEERRLKDRFAEIP